MFLNECLYNVCNLCHDLLMISMNLSHIAMLNIKSADYHCIILAELAKVRPKFYQFD